MKIFLDVCYVVVYDNIGMKVKVNLYVKIRKKCKVHIYTHYSNQRITSKSSLITLGY